MSFAISNREDIEYNVNKATNKIITEASMQL